MLFVRSLLEEDLKSLAHSVKGSEFRDLGLDGGRTPETGTRVVIGVDSRVVCGAFSKGRSSSYQLNGVLRSLLPYLIACRVSGAVGAGARGRKASKD